MKPTGEWGILRADPSVMETTRMKKFAIAGLLLPLVALSACSKDEPTDSAGALSEEELATMLWDEIQGYESWDTPESWPENSVSADGTHGAYVSIYINDVEAAGGGDGAIIVKKGYDSAEGADPKDGVTVMWKTADFESESGWFWAKYDDAGEASVTGEAGACTGCHSASSDYQTYKNNSPGTEE